MSDRIQSQPNAIEDGHSEAHHMQPQPPGTVQAMQRTDSLAQLPFHLSSRRTGWKNVVVEEHRVEAAGEIALPKLPMHSLTFVLGQPFRLFQERCGRIQERIVSPETVCVWPADEHNHIQWQDNAHVLHVRLDAQFVARMNVFEEGTGRSGHIDNSFGHSDPQAFHLALALKAELEGGCLRGPMYAETIASVLSMHLLQRFAAPVEPRTWSMGLSGTDLDRTRAYIDANLDTSLTLAEMAAQAHISPYHFTRLFKQSTGLPPYQYVISQRVERAKSLLTTGGLSIAEVASAVGFGNQSHLNFHFKRLVGITPRIFALAKKGR